MTAIMRPGRAPAAGDSPDPGGRGAVSDGVDAAAAGSAPAARLSIQPSAGWLRALDLAIVGSKAATLVCALDALVNFDSPRLRGKAVRTRAVGYTVGVFVVPAVWRMLPRRGRYPRGLDLAVTTPLLIDAAGNALGLYNEAHLDDVVHFLNSGIVSGVAGALFAGTAEKPWQAAVAGTTTAIAAEAVWEVAEYAAMRAGADGMGLTYQDTIADMFWSSLGAMAGGVVTWLRMPRAKAERRRGWRHAVSGWRDAGEPLSIVGAKGTVADTAAAGPRTPA